MENKTITKIKPIAKNMFHVYVEEQFAFSLYGSELFRYHLKEGSIVKEQDYEMILRETILPRAKKKALRLLEDMDRTRGELKDRLKRSGFPEEIIKETLDYVDSFGYLDDGRYACNYIFSKKTSKSRRQIEAHLYEKGLDTDIVSKAMDEVYSREDAKKAIRHMADKRHYNPKDTSVKDRQKFYGYLARKGFTYDEICQALETDWDFA